LRLAALAGAREQLVRVGCGEFMLKGFQRPVAAFNVIAIREPAAELYSVQSE
jgi:hypothetical protein